MAVEVGATIALDETAKIHDSIRDGGLPVEELLNLVGNQTAARNEDIFKVLGLLATEGEPVIRSSSRPTTLPQGVDRLELPVKKTFFPMLKKGDC